LLKIRNLTLTLGEKKIFDDVSLEVTRGEIYALLGRNGTGKSTLAAVILGLIKPEKGDIYFEDELINDFSLTERAKRGIILAWQKNITVQGLTVRDYVRVSAPNGISDAEVEEHLESVGLSCGEYLDRAIDGKLSGGERKRIELASVLAAKPKLAILDEPDSGIDAVSLVMVESAIRRMAQDGAVLLITHTEDILGISTRAGILCGARIIREAKPDAAVQYFKNHCDYCETVNTPRLDEIITGSVNP